MKRLCQCFDLGCYASGKGSVVHQQGPIYPPARLLTIAGVYRDRFESSLRKTYCFICLGAVFTSCLLYLLTTLTVLNFESLTQEMCDKR